MAGLCRHILSELLLTSHQGTSSQFFPVLVLASHFASVAGACAQYTVNPGDTACAIAAKCGIELPELLASNSNYTDSWNNLRPSQILGLPEHASCNGFPSYPCTVSSSENAPTAGITNTPTIIVKTTSSSPAPSVPAPASATRYNVEKGDTAYSIALKFGISLDALESANVDVVADWNILPVGIQLIIPQTTGATIGTPNLVPVNSTALVEASSSTPSSTIAPSITTPSTQQSPQPTVPPVSVWTITSGDTGHAIASNVSVPFFAISSANPTVTWSLLSIGQTLTIPPSPTALVQVIETAAVHDFSVDIGNSVAKPNYIFYSGNGSVAAGWPQKSDWVSFNVLFSTVQPFIGKKCVENVLPNSPEETDQVRDAILSVANQTYLDPRFILAVTMQESNGCVRVNTTMNANPNPGLLQSFNGKGTCNRNGTLDTPCPQPVIKQMIEEGTAAPVDGITLVGALNQALDLPGCEEAQAFYRAARLYNSGPNSLGPATNGDLGSPIDGATLCYASDIVNRLMGWIDGPSACTLDR